MYKCCQLSIDATYFSNHQTHKVLKTGLKCCFIKPCITDIIVIYLYKKAYAYLYVDKCHSALISEPMI